MSKPAISEPPFEEARLAFALRPLDELCLGVFDCPHTTPALADVGPYVVRSQDIRTGVFRYETAGRVTEETYRHRIARAEPTFGDVLLSREGTYFGIAAEVPRDMKVCLGQRMVLIRPNPSLLDARYLRYWINSPRMAAHVAGFRDGSVAERLNMPTIRALPIGFRPLHEQRAIAAVLGALDDKIESNRRMNATLEALARALFKTWFVDFDPVRAKMEGRTPAMAYDLAALFPARLTDSPLGPIPEGWELSTIGKAVEVIGGNTPSTDEPSFWGGKNAWVTPKDLSGLSDPVLLSTDRTLTDEGLSRVSSGLLPIDTVLLSSRAPIGYLAIAKLPVAVNQGFVAMVCGGKIGPHFAYFWTSFAHDEIVNRANGSTFLEISKGSFRGIELAVPPAEVCNAFEEIARPAFERIATNAHQSRTLAQLRDLLLPKLLSGALRVRDAERMIGDAA